MTSPFNVILDTRPGAIPAGVVQRTDFKQVLKFFRLINDPDFTDQEKAQFTIRLFFEEREKENGEKYYNAPNDPELFKKIEWFIQCGVESDSGNTEKPVFDYCVDHGRIFAAFLQAYGIDLRNTSLHWWVFCELLQNLPDETKLMQVIDLRAKKPGKHDSPEYVKKLRKLQRSVKIDRQTHDEAEAVGNLLDKAWG